MAFTSAFHHHRQQPPTKEDEEKGVGGRGDFCKKCVVASGGYELGCRVEGQVVVELD